MTFKDLGLNMRGIFPDTAEVGRVELEEMMSGHTCITFVSKYMSPESEQFQWEQWIPSFTAFVAMEQLL